MTDHDSTARLKAKNVKAKNADDRGCSSPPANPIGFPPYRITQLVFVESIFVPRLIPGTEEAATLFGILVRLDGRV